MEPRVKTVMGSPLSKLIQPGSAHFAMVEKTALHNLDELMRTDMQAARLIVSLIRLIEPGSGGVVVISRAAMAELLEVSLPTVQRALKTLVAGKWVQRIKIGGAYALAVNKAVAWVGPRGQLDHAVFSATVVASRSEQDAAGINPGDLRQLPMAQLGEEVLPIGQTEPPAQELIPGTEQVVRMGGHLPKIWSGSGTQEHQRKAILHMLESLGIDTSDAPEGREELLQYVAQKESELHAQNVKN